MINKPMIGVAVLVVAAGLGTWYFLQSRSSELPRVTVPAPLTSEATPTEPPIEHPLPKSADDAAAQAMLPALADSDAVVTGVLADVLGAAAVMAYLVPESVVRHIVVTVDNLPRQKVALEKRPIVPTAGTLIVEGDELHANLDTKNFDRYRPMVDALLKVDVQKLGAAYVRLYPLFQRAYQDLGYPSGYFNDRLVQVIDVMLATPQPAAPLELVRPNVLYVFSDPALEARPAGQKLLLRMGPDNAALIKKKLMELRALVTAAPLHH